MEDHQAAPSLPDDVVLEILARVGAADVAALFRCTTACRRWRGLIADPSFLRRLWTRPEHARQGRPSSVLGFFVPSYREGGDPSPVFIPSPRSAIASRRGFLESSVQAGAGPLDRAVPLASRHGLLLVRLDPPHQEAPLLHMPPSLRLAVCDLLAGTYAFLPPLNRHDEPGTSSYAILTDADCCAPNGQRRRRPSLALFFKVLVLAMDGNLCKVYTFSTAADPITSCCWSEACIPCVDLADDHPDPIVALGPSDAVVWRDTVLWLVWGTIGFHILGVGVESGHLSFTPISITPKSISVPFLSVAADGSLTLVYRHGDALQAEIWTRQDHHHDDNADHVNIGWIGSSVIKKMELPEGKKLQTTWLPYGEWLAAKSGTLFVEDTRHVYVADLETGVMEEVADSFPLGVLCTSRHNIVPFEMDWPGYFASRLGSE